MNLQLEENLNSIRERISAAAKTSGRSSDQVCLVGVTKYVDVELTRALFLAGCKDLGESRPQVLWDKSDSLKDLAINWHMIGHLQRNKVKRTIGNCCLIHSVDSQRLLTAINNTALEEDKIVNVLLEVNVSAEEAKHGFEPQDIEGAIAFVSGLKNVSVRGLMCMAGLNGEVNHARREFELLRTIREKHSNAAPENVRLEELSMGMSGDFEIAIEEGATMVRVGSSLFRGT